MSGGMEPTNVPYLSKDIGRRITFCLVTAVTNGNCKVKHRIMHFSKTYSQLLLTLPQELQDNAIEYRQVSLRSASVRRRVIYFGVLAQKAHKQGRSRTLFVGSQSSSAS